MATKLDASTVANLKAGPTPYYVSDLLVPGLQLRIGAADTGGEKTWSVRYNFLKQQKRRTLGSAKVLKVGDARAAAKEVLRRVANGVDPQAEEQAAVRAAEQAQRDSVDVLCANYIERHAKVKKRTWRADQGKLKNDVLPEWKSRPVSSITRRDCKQLVQAIADRGAPTVANRVAITLGLERKQKRAPSLADMLTRDV